MKKILTLIISIFCLIGLQNINAQTISAGYLNGAYKTTDSGLSFSMQGNGAYVGADMDFTIADYLYVTPGVFVDFMAYRLFDNTTARALYLRAPIHLKVAADFNGVNVFATAGPSLQFAVAGKLHYHDGGINYTEDFFDEDSQRFDVPIGVSGGVEFGNFRFTVGYDWGMLNQNRTDDVTLKRNFLHVGVGYRF